MSPFGPSPFGPARSFRAARAESIGEHLLGLRIGLARELLRDRGLPVERVAELAGFGSHAYFCRRFKETVGLTPSAYRRA